MNEEKEPLPLPCQVINRYGKEIIDRGLRQYGSIVGQPRISKFVRRVNKWYGIKGAIAAYDRVCRRGAEIQLKDTGEQKDNNWIEAWRIIYGMAGIVEGLIVLGTRTPKYAQRLHKAEFAGNDWPDWVEMAGGYGEDTHVGTPIFGESSQFDYQNSKKGWGVRTGDAEKF